MDDTTFDPGLTSPHCTSIGSIYADNSVEECSRRYFRHEVDLVDRDLNPRNERCTKRRKEVTSY
jgi:hypothetical protein